MLLGYLVKGYVIFAFYLQLLFNIFILCHVFRTETLISFPCTSRKSRVLKSSGKGYALKSFLRNQSCSALVHLQCHLNDTLLSCVPTCHVDRAGEGQAQD